MLFLSVITWLTQFILSVARLALKLALFGAKA